MNLPYCFMSAKYPRPNQPLSLLGFEQLNFPLKMIPYVLLQVFVQVLNVTVVVNNQYFLQKPRNRSIYNGMYRSEQSVIVLIVEAYYNTGRRQILRVFNAFTSKTTVLLL